MTTVRKPQHPALVGAIRAGVLWAAIITSFVILASCSGCATTPEVQYTQAQDTYIAVVHQLINFRQAGEINDEDWEDIVFAINEGDRILNAIKGYVVRKQDPPQDLIGALQAVVDVLSAYAASAESGDNT